MIAQQSVSNLVSPNSSGKPLFAMLIHLRPLAIPLRGLMIARHRIQEFSHVKTLVILEVTKAENVQTRPSTAMICLRRCEASSILELQTKETLKPHRRAVFSFASEQMFFPPFVTTTTPSK